MHVAMEHGAYHYVHAWHFLFMYFVSQIVQQHNDTAIITLF